MRGNLDLLRREPPISDPDRLAVLTVLVEESDRLIRMVNDLLVLARSVNTVAEDSRVEVCVCDTGPGIAADELSRIFDRFYIVDTARTQNSTGLGLAIAKTLVESQNGEIAVSSTVGRGTTFKVLLSCQN